MKRIIASLLVVFLPLTGFAAFTEFYCSPTTTGHSNLNAGSTTGAALYTSTNGNWSTVTHIFTPTDGQTTSNFVSVGDWVSLYLNAASVTPYIARVTVVGAGVNGTITTSSTAFAGTAPSTGTGTVSCKDGGVWTGPNAGDATPFGLASFSAATDASGNTPRINLKNDSSYSCSALITLSGVSLCVIQGYSSTPGDGGKAIITNSVNNTNPAYNVSSATSLWTDLIFAETATLNSNDMVGISGGFNTFFRCVFHGARGSGISSSTGTVYIECEAYDDNKSNTANKGGFANGGVYRYCYSHDNASGSNAHGWVYNTASINVTLDHCIASNNVGSGVLIGTGASNSVLTVSQSDFYNNTGDGVNDSGSATNISVFFTNSNFVKNGGKGLNMVTSHIRGYEFNCGYGSGTQANGSSDVLQDVVASGSVTYASGAVPWNAPTTGDFSLVLSTATWTGRGAFTETDGTHSGTVGYPSIGAAEAAGSVVCPTPTPTATATATATATPTSTPTPTAPIETSYTFGQ